MRTLEPDTETEFFNVDRETETQIANFFFAQRTRVLEEIKRFREKPSKARELVLAQTDYDALCFFELLLGLKHESQASNLAMRLRLNHALTLQKIFASKEIKFRRLRKQLSGIIVKHTKATLFRAPPRKLKLFFDTLMNEPID